MQNEFEEPFDDAIDFRKLFTTLQSWAWLLILAAVLSALSAYVYSRQQTPVYEATTNILVTRNSQQTVGDLSQSLNLSQLVETYVRMLSLDEFLNIVSARLGYKVETGNVNVSALTNTQVIQLKVQDADPVRAALIADTMVVVLAEQNESLQAGRYTEAEQSLDIQIQESEARIADVQAQLDTARTSALAEQILQAQSNIDTTVNAIKVATAELQRLHKTNWIDTHFLLRDKKIRLPQQQVLLDQQIAEQSELQAKLASDPQAQTDPAYAAVIKAKITEMDAKIEKTRQMIEETQSEIIFLTPLDTEQGFNATVVEKENFLKTQQSLLVSYQNVYTSLLTTEEVKRTTNEIDNLKQNLDLYQNIYLDLLSKREDVKNQKMQNIPTIEQVSPALASENPVKPRTLLNTLLGGLAGLILALSFVMIRDMTDDTVKSREEVEKLLGTKVIGYVIENESESDGQGIFVGREPRSPVAEAFRTLRTNLEFSGREKPIKSIIVTSGGPGEGKTTIASNLAAILSHSGKKVILVDADLRRPRIHQYIGISNATGLSDLISMNPEPPLAEYLQKLDGNTDLSVLTSGGLPSNPTDLLGSKNMKTLLNALSDSYDYVVIDCPPMLVADPQVLLGLADGVLLVIVPGQTRQDVMRAVKEQVAHTRVRLLGVVFNRLTQNRRAGYGGYSYYAYPYYYSSDYYSIDKLDGKPAENKKGLWHRKGKNKPKPSDSVQ
jgi:capsular exopolysaccharide synthesis family protein